jgi:hypothetical protein
LLHAEEHQSLIARVWKTSALRLEPDNQIQIWPN